MSFKLGVKEWGICGWAELCINRRRSDMCRKKGHGDTDTGRRLFQRNRELIPETRWSISKGTISYSEQGWWWIGGRSRVMRWRASAARRLNSDEVMQIWTLGGCKNFVLCIHCLYSRLVFKAIGYFEPVDMIRYGMIHYISINQSIICYGAPIWRSGAPSNKIS